MESARRSQGVLSEPVTPRRSARAEPDEQHHRADQRNKGEPIPPAGMIGVVQPANQNGDVRQEICEERQSQKQPANAEGIKQSAANNDEALEKDEKPIFRSRCAPGKSRVLRVARSYSLAECHRGPPIGRVKLSYPWLYTRRGRKLGYEFGRPGDGYEPDEVEVGSQPTERAFSPPNGLRGKVARSFGPGRASRLLFKAAAAEAFAKKAGPWDRPFCEWLWGQDLNL
jgi:hypothetical protein